MKIISGATKEVKIKNSFLVNSASMFGQRNDVT